MIFCVVMVLLENMLSREFPNLIQRKRELPAYIGYLFSKERFGWQLWQSFRFLFRFGQGKPGSIGKTFDLNW